MTAFNTAALGLLRSQNDFTRATSSFIRSFTPALGASVGEVGALNQVAPNPLQGPGQNQGQNQNINPFEGNAINPQTLASSSLVGLFNASSTDPISSFVNLIQAEHAFGANIAALKTIDEVEQQLLDIKA